MKHLILDLFEYSDLNKDAKKVASEMHKRNKNNLFDSDGQILYNASIAEIKNVRYLDDMIIDKSDYVETIYEGLSEEQEIEMFDEITEKKDFDVIMDKFMKPSNFEYCEDKLSEIINSIGSNDVSVIMLDNQYPVQYADVQLFETLYQIWENKDNVIFHKQMDKLNEIANI